MWSSVSLTSSARSRPSSREVAAQGHQRLAVEAAGHVERAVEEDLRLADAEEQVGVLVRDRRAVRRRAAATTSPQDRSRNAPLAGASVTATRSCAYSSAPGGA